MKKMIFTLLSLFILLTLCSPAYSTLVFRDAFQDAALSIDAFGGDSGLLQTEIAADSTILAAYLYSSSIWSGGVSAVQLNGTTLDPTTDGTLLGPDENPTTNYVYDVTSLLTPTIDGVWGLQDHTITELGNNDGEVLVVAYSNASTLGSTAIIMDGELSTTGDSTTLNFADPYEGGDFLMSLAISFGNDTSNVQYTEVDVTTDSTTDRRLTSGAGGNNDGQVLANGQLITAGGVGDDPTNPTDPFAHSGDDELYNLALGNGLDPTPFINTGDTFLQLTTSNPSADDNVFGLFISSSFTIDQIDDIIIDDGDDTAPVPEPGTILLMGIGLAGLAATRLRKKKS